MSMGMGAYKETGIEELRRIVAAANWARESAFDGFTAEECVRLVRACWGSKWDILPDHLLHEERLEAARTGKLSEACEERLDHDLGDAPDKTDDEETCGACGAMFVPMLIGDMWHGLHEDCRAVREATDEDVSCFGKEMP
jgi:hypothetical protein